MRDADHLGSRRHLEVEPRGDRFPEASDIVVPDVATISTQVNGNAVGSAEFREHSCRNGIGFNGLARLPDSCYVIDVYS